MELIKQLEVAEGIRIDILTRIAYDHLMENMLGFGNSLSTKHKSALRNLLSTYSLLATKAKSYRGRYGYPLSVGAGKTQSIVSFCYAVNKYNADISVLVSQPKVEALAELKRNLVKAGIPESRIAFVHSYQYNKRHADDVLNGNSKLKPNHSTEPSTTGTPKDYQILLVTHERLRSSKDIEAYSSYKRGQRNLTIYDESFFHSHATAVSAASVKFNLAGSKTIKNVTATFTEALDYISDCIDIVDAKPDAVMFPERTSGQLEVYKKSILDALKGERAVSLIEFLDVCQEKIRVLYTQQGEGVITYEIVLPEVLGRVVVLDASFNIRDLQRLDRSLKVAEGYTDVKRFDNVEVNQIVGYRSGRNSVDQKLRARQPLTEELIDHVVSWPEDDATIFWTFKSKNKNYNPEKVIRDELARRGIDSNQIIMVNGVERNRFVFQTFGNETNTSTYSYCTNTVFAGVLRRSHLDLASCITGQCDDLHVGISNEMLKRIELSEMAHVVYQAAGRSRMRMTDSDGQAMKSRVLLIGVEDYSRYMDEAMKGVKWDRIPSTQEDNRYTISEVAKQIVVFMKDFQGSRISVVRLKKEIGLTRVPPTTFKLARNLALEASPFALQGKSLVRMFDAVV